MADFPRCMAVFSGYVLVIFCRSLEALRPKNILDRLGNNHSIRLRCLFFKALSFSVVFFENSDSISFGVPEKL